MATARGKTLLATVLALWIVGLQAQTSKEMKVCQKDMLKEACVSFTAPSSTALLPPTNPIPVSGHLVAISGVFSLPVVVSLWRPKDDGLCMLEQWNVTSDNRLGNSEHTVKRLDYKNVMAGDYVVVYTKRVRAGSCFCSARTDLTNEEKTKCSKTKHSPQHLHPFHPRTLKVSMDVSIRTPGLTYQIEQKSLYEISLTDNEIDTTTKSPTTEEATPMPILTRRPSDSRETTTKRESTSEPTNQSENDSTMLATKPSATSENESTSEPTNQSENDSTKPSATSENESTSEPTNQSENDSTKPSATSENESTSEPTNQSENDSTMLATKPSATIESESTSEPANQSENDSTMLATKPSATIENESTSEPANQSETEAPPRNVLHGTRAQVLMVTLSIIGCAIVFVIIGTVLGVKCMSPLLDRLAAQKSMTPDPPQDSRSEGRASVFYCTIDDAHFSAPCEQPKSPRASYETLGHVTGLLCAASLAAVSPAAVPPAAVPPGYEGLEDTLIRLPPLPPIRLEENVYDNALPYVADMGSQDEIENFYITLL